jgi:glutathione S-transferase
MLTLYYAPHTCSLASHIALEEAGASYELKRLDIDKKEHHRQDYLAINAKARVPAMVTPRGILTETPAMLAFIAQTYPAAKLAPIDDPFAFGEVQAFRRDHRHAEKSAAERRRRFRSD